MCAEPFVPEADGGRRQRSGSEGRFDHFPSNSSSTFYLTPESIHVSPRQSLSVVVPTHSPNQHPPSSPRCRSRSPAPSPTPSAFSTIASIAATSMAAGAPAAFSNYHQRPSYDTVRGHVIGHRPMPVLTSGSATLPSHVSPRGLPPKSTRPSILPNGGSGGARMGTIKEATFLTSEQVSRV